MEDLVTRMKVSDYIARRLAFLGLDTCFMVTGGGAMHLNDSFGASKSYSKIYNHHEQASAMAAEGYARIAGKPAVVCVTTGPGAINALNGVFGAYTDSIPMVVVAGQVKTETISTEYPELKSIRQLGDQELKSMEMVRPITKWSAQVTETALVASAVDEAFFQAVQGRPGPVWLEVPVDIQAADIDVNPEAPPTFSFTEDAIEVSEGDLRYVAQMLMKAKRPVILAGSGVRHSNTQDILVRISELAKCPVTTAWTHDIFDNDHPLFAGRPGTIGTRPGNFVIQNADYVLVLGSRLNIRQVSYAWKNFATQAEVTWVDIDDEELRKPFPSVDKTVKADLRFFLPNLLDTILTMALETPPERRGWLSWTQAVNAEYSPKYSDYVERQSGINPYHFIFELFSNKRSDDVFVLGNASACILPFQVGKLGQKNRMFSNSGSASMGYDLPAAIGAAAADQSRRTICLAGDGSIMMNLQELSTMKAQGANLALIILDNGGYLSIKQTQNNFFHRENGASQASGVHFPNFIEVVKAFGLPAVEVRAGESWQESLQEFLEEIGPRVLIAKLDREQEFEPRLKSKMVDGKIQTPALDDMHPHLSDELLLSIRSKAKSDRIV